MYNNPEMCISYKTAICMYMDSQTLFHSVLLHYTMHTNRHTEQGFYIKPTFAGATERGLFMQGKKLLSQKAETNAMLTLLLALLFCGNVGSTNVNSITWFKYLLYTISAARLFPYSLAVSRVSRSSFLAHM